MVKDPRRLVNGSLMGRNALSFSLSLSLSLSLFFLLHPSKREEWAGIGGQMTSLTSDYFSFDTGSTLAAGSSGSAFRFLPPCIPFLIEPVATEWRWMRLLSCVCLSDVIAAAGWEIKTSLEPAPSSQWEMRCKALTRWYVVTGRQLISFFVLFHFLFLPFFFLFFVFSFFFEFSQRGK